MRQRQFRSAAARGAIALSIALLPAAAFAQSSPLFDLGLSVAPNSEGKLESDSFVSVNWFDYLESRARYATNGFTTVTQEDSGSETLLVDQKTVELTILQTRAKAFDALLGAFGLEGLGFLDLDAGFFLKYLRQEDRKYGYSEAPSLSLDYDTKTTEFWKPLLRGSAGVSLPYLGAHFELEFSPGQLKESVEGSYLSSPGMAKPADYSSDDRGFETRYSGKLRGTIPGIAVLELEGSSFEHIGYSVKYDSLTGVAKYVYSSAELSFSLKSWLGFVRALKLARATPMIGVSWVRHDFAPLKRYGIPGYSNDRVKFLFGIDMAM